MSVLKPDRDLANLKPEMRIRVEATIADLAAEGINIFVTEGIRSKARQLYLYAGGRRFSTDFEIRYLGYDHPDIRPRPNEKQVTWTLQSNHFSGEAVDIAFKGPVLYPNYDTQEGRRLWNRVWDVAEKNGLKSLVRSQGGTDLAHLDFNADWLPSKHWADDYETVLVNAGVIDKRKPFDTPINPAVICKMLVEAVPELKKEYEKLTK